MRQPFEYQSDNEFIGQALPLFFSTNDHISSAAMASVSTFCTSAL
jgi:hypothetical protein